MGEKANRKFSKLEVIEIDSPMYRIDEYDGMESVETPDSVDWVTNSNVLCVSDTLDKLLDYCKDKFNLSVVDIEQFEKWYCLEDVVDSDGELCALIIDWVAYLQHEFDASIGLEDDTKI